MKRVNRNTGITLIALVITIIVLLILASITIAALTGDNGILTRAAEAKNKTEESQEKEGLELAVTSSQMEDANTLEITEEKLSDAIKQQFGNDKEFSITDNRDGSFFVSMNDTQRMYYIDETGKVIDKILKISTVEELKTFRDNVNSGNTYEGWYVYLTNDITLNSSEKWESIGIYQNGNSIPFSGIFDGKHKNIVNMIIDSEYNYQGLFGCNNGEIKNLKVSNSTIHGNAYIAGIVGYNSGRIKNCVSEANIFIAKTSEYNAYVAGICAYNESGTIDGCFNNSEIDIDKFTISGVCAKNVQGTVKNSYNRSNICGMGEISGIIGTDVEGDIYNCYNCGKINASQSGCGRNCCYI